MSQRAKKEKRLQKAGYTTIKGQFGAVRSMRGGAGAAAHSPNRVGTSIMVGDPFRVEKLNLTKDAVDKAIAIGLIPNDFNFDSREKHKTESEDNPNNAIFIDKIKNIVYKVGYWGSRGKDEESRCIKNEVLAYKRLMSKYSDDIDKHYPEMYSYSYIEETQYAVISLKYLGELHNPKENTIDNYFKEANDYLISCHINNDDLRNNIFLQSERNTNEYNVGKFVLIDFEQVQFTDELIDTKIEEYDKKFDSERELYLKKKRNNLRKRAKFSMYPNNSLGESNTPSSPSSPETSDPAIALSFNNVGGGNKKRTSKKKKK